VDDGIVGTEIQSTKISSDSSVEDTSFFEYIAKIDVGVEEVRI
jgi:hypothetical protein